MRLFPMMMLPILMCARLAMAGESALATTYQPLDGLGSGQILVAPVACHYWHAGSGVGSVVDLIHLRNVPPTGNPREADDDLNLASRCHLRFSTNDLGDPKAVPMVALDATAFDEAKAGGYEKEDIVRASLECLRQCLPEKVKTTKLTLKCKEGDKEWLSKVVAEFDAAPRDKPFYQPEWTR